MFTVYPVIEAGNQNSDNDRKIVNTLTLDRDRKTQTPLLLAREQIRWSENWNGDSEAIKRDSETDMISVLSLDFRYCRRLVIMKHLSLVWDKLEGNCVSTVSPFSTEMGIINALCCENASLCVVVKYTAKVLFSLLYNLQFPLFKLKLCGEK